MGRKLTAIVALRSPEDGVVQVFGPHDTVPQWAAEKITNPSLWEGEPDTGDKQQGDAADTSGDEPKRPYGNASKADWIAYATQKGIDIPEGANKNEIIALLEGK